MGYTPRQSAAAFSSISTFDSPSLGAGSYSGAASLGCNDEMVVGLTAIKGAGAFVQGAASASASGGSDTVSLAFGSDNVNGNSIVVDASMASLFGPGATSATCADTQGNTYTLAGSKSVLGGNLIGFTFVATGVKPGANAVTVTFMPGFSDAPGPVTLAIHEYAGGAAIDAYDGADVVSSGTGTPSVTTSATGDLLHLAVFIDVACSGSPYDVTGGSPLNPPFPTPNWLVINEPSIGITDRSGYLYRGEKNSHTWSNEIRQRGPATIPLWIPANDSYTPVRGTPCYLFDETPGPVWTLVFAGLIQDLEYKNSGVAGYRILTITAVSLESIFDTVYCDGTDFFQNQTCGAIVTALFAKYENSSPVSLGTISPGVTIPLFAPAKGTKISELLDQLASTSLFTWGVNPQTQQLYFTAPSTIPAPFTLTNQHVLWDSILWKVNGADYRNRQQVKLADAAFPQSGEFFAGAGQQTFTLLRPVKQVVSAYVTVANPNFAVGTFSGQPSAGDTITIGPANRPWSHGTYLIGTVIVSGGYVQQVTFAGTSGATLPAFSTVTGATTTDGSVIWTCLGPYGTGAGEQASSTYTYVLAAPASAWVPSTAYTPGQQINASGFIQQCTTGGTSGGKLPDFNATGGGTTADGSVVWTNENPCLDNTQAFQIAIGTTLADTVQNTVDAINATAPYGGPPATQGKGLTFSLPTWEGAQVNASLTSGSTLKVTNKQAAIVGVSALSTTSSAFIWSGTQTAGGSFPNGSVGPNEGSAISISVYPQGTSTASPGLAYQEGSAVIGLATPLNSGTNLNVWYTRADGGSIEVENTSLVQSLAAISHGTGKYQQTTDQSTQGLISTSALAGLQFAQQILEAFSVTPTSFQFKSYHAGLFPGMTLTAALSVPLQGTGLLNGEWVIETVQGEFLRAKPYFGQYGHYRYTVKLVDIQEIDSWLDFWKGMATGSGSGSGGVTGGPLVATSGGPLSTPAHPLQLETNGSANSSQAVLNLTAGAGITLTDGGGGNIQIAGSTVLPTALKYTTSWTAQTSVTVTHNLGTSAVLVQTFDAGANVVIPQGSTITSANVVTLAFGATFTGSVVVVGFGSAPPSQQYSTSWTAQSSVTLTHNLATTNVFVQVYDAGGNQVIPQDIAIMSSNVVTLTFGAPFSGSVVVIGLSVGVRQFNASFTNQTSVTVTHGLGTTAVIVQTYDGSGNQVIPQNIAVTDANDVTLTFGASFTGSAVVIG